MKRVNYHLAFWTITFISLSLFTVSCHSATKKLFSEGKILQTDFDINIPFSFEQNLPFVIIKINDKSYKFLLDTGAPTVISEELFADLKLKPRFENILRDSQGNSQKEKFVSIPEMQLYDLTFLHIGAVVTDLKKTQEIRCLEIDGILGANQMAKAIWEIDYKNQIIRISDNFENFDLRNLAYTLNFTPKKVQKTPLIKSKINHTECYLTYDTGANNFLELPLEYVKDSIGNYDKASFFGISSAGIYGNSEPSPSYLVKIPEFYLDTTVWRDQYITFNSTVSTIGNRFLKNYNTILNWKTRKIYLKAIHDVESTPILDSWGFLPRIMDNNFVVVEILLSDSSEIQLEDIIISIDETDLSIIQNEDICDFILYPILKDKTTADFTFLRGDSIFTKTITRFNLFQ